MIDVESFPEDAYNAAGTLLWKTTAGSRQRAAAWLWFNKREGDTFTMAELREALAPLENAEHLNRRLRELRDVDWELPTNKDDATLGTDEYRLEKRGARIWLKSERQKYQVFKPSDRIRRQVFERDGSRCQECGLAAGEPWPDDPRRRTVLTIGHMIPQNRLDRQRRDDNINNWRTECKRCNESVRDQIRDPHTYEEAFPMVKPMPRKNKETLLSWLHAGHRLRNRLDEVYDIVRKLSEADKARLREYLERAV